MRSGRVTTVVNGRFLSRRTTGVERYAREILAGVDSLEAKGNTSLEILYPPSNPSTSSLSGLPGRSVGRLQGHAWEQFELPFYSFGRPLLNLCNLAPIIRGLQLTVVHDGAVFATPESFSWPFRRYYQSMLPLIARRSTALVTVSEFSRAQLAHYLRLRLDSISVIPPGVDHIIRVQPDIGAVARFGLQGEPFVLAISSIDPRKNLSALLRAACLLPNQLFALAGGQNRNVFSGQGLKVPSNVRVLGHVSDAELKSLLNHAACFVFPSLYEGFGLPPLEAMACGCPVVSADSASLPEVCGTAAVYCDPHNPKDIAEKLNSVIQDRQLADKLRQRGSQRASMFTWRKSAQQLLSVVEDVFA